MWHTLLTQATLSNIGNFRKDDKNRQMNSANQQEPSLIYQGPNYKGVKAACSVETDILHLNFYCFPAWQYTLRYALKMLGKGREVQLPTDHTTGLHTVIMVPTTCLLKMGSA